MFYPTGKNDPNPEKIWNLGYFHILDFLGSRNFPGWLKNPEFQIAGLGQHLTLLQFGGTISGAAYKTTHFLVYVALLPFVGDCSGSF